MNARLETPHVEQLFALPCGCIAVTSAAMPFEVRWCPHHRALHGVVPADFAKPSRDEERAYSHSPIS
jgi:hypothetical protein